MAVKLQGGRWAVGHLKQRREEVAIECEEVAIEAGDDDARWLAQATLAIYQRVLERRLTNSDQLAPTLRLELPLNIVGN